MRTSWTRLAIRGSNSSGGPTRCFAVHRLNRLEIKHAIAATSDILASGNWNGSPAGLDEIIARQQISHLQLPIRDAIDYVHSYIFSTIKAFKFSQMSQRSCPG